MRSVMKSKMLILPHVFLGGGAALYIKQFIKLINNEFDIKLVGKYSSSYGESSSDPLYNVFNTFVFPNYEGVKWIKILYFLVKGIFSVPSLQKSSSKIDEDSGFFVCTSGIQVLLFPFLRCKYPNKKLILLMQENWILNNFIFGRLSIYFLKKFDGVISITDSWSDKANKYGIASYVLVNSFTLPKNDIVKDDFSILSSFEDDFFDVAFVGGEQNIKGFDTFIDFFSALSLIKDVKFCLVGYLSDETIIRIKKLNLKAKKMTDSEIFFFGMVEDINPIIIKSKYLLLALTHAHFCRPAIEFGLHRKTFFIRNLEGISDFATPDFNCLAFENLNELVEKYSFISSSSSDSEVLGNNNFKMSLYFLENESASFKLYGYLSNI